MDSINLISSVFLYFLVLFIEKYTVVEYVHLQCVVLTLCFFLKTQVSCDIALYPIRGRDQRILHFTP